MMGNILAPSELYANFSIHALELNGSNCSKSYQPQHDAQRNFFFRRAWNFGGRVQVCSWRQKLNYLPSIVRQTDISPPHKSKHSFRPLEYRSGPLIGSAMPGLTLIDHSPHHPAPVPRLPTASNLILIDNYDSFT